MTDFLFCIIIFLALVQQSQSTFLTDNAGSALEPKLISPGRRLFRPLLQFRNSSRNLNILLNGEPVHRSFSSTIGKNSYVVTDLLTVLHNLYCYRGHVEGNPNDSILIKVFGKSSPDAYYEEMERAGNDGNTILLEYDDKNRILVEKYDKPFFTVVGNTQFVLTQELAATSERLVYLGHKMGDDPANSLILKFYTKDETALGYYSKEKKCMKELGRLVEFGEDRSKYTIVEKFVPGKLLKDALNDNTFGKDALLEKCQMKLNMLHRKLKMSHNNIKPYNIIVSDDGEVSFLDFSRAEELSSNKDVASAQRLKDMRDLLFIFRRRLPRLLSAPF